MNKTEVEHLSHLNVLLVKYGLNNKPSKFIFGVQTLQFLSLVVSCDTPTKKITSTTVDLPSPSSIRQAQHFLDVVNYYHRFLQRSALLAPVYNRVAAKSKKVKPKPEFTWPEYCQPAFDSLHLNCLTAQNSYGQTWIRRTEYQFDHLHMYLIYVYEFLPKQHTCTILLIGSLLTMAGSLFRSLSDFKYVGRNSGQYFSGILYTLWRVLDFWCSANFDDRLTLS